MKLGHRKNIPSSYHRMAKTILSLRASMIVFMCLFSVPSATLAMSPSGSSPATPTTTASTTISSETSTACTSSCSACRSRGEDENWEKELIPISNSFHFREEQIAQVRHWLTFLRSRIPPVEPLGEEK